MGEALRRGSGSERIATARWGTAFELWERCTQDQGAKGTGIYVGGVPRNGNMADSDYRWADEWRRWWLHGGWENGETENSRAYSRIVGRRPDEAFYSSIFLETEKHALLCADTRSGKGRSSIIPTLATWRGGAFVNDIKGELAGITAASRGKGDKYAQGLNTPVYVFDPLKVADVDASYRVRFNPIDLIDPQDPAAVSVARSIANGVIIPDPRSSSHWDERARNWITGLCLYAAIAPHLEGKRTLSTVRELAIEGDIILEEIEAAKVRELNRQRDEDGEKRLPIPKGKDVLLHTMTNMGDFDGELRRLAKDFTDIPPNERGSIYSTLSRNLGFLGDKRVRDALEKSDFSIEDLRRKGATLYVCIPPNELENLKWLSRLMTTLVWDRFGRMGQLQKTEKQCLFVLDEFAAMGHLPEISNQLAAAASYGAKMWIIVQNLTQLKELYGSYGRFVGGAGILQFFEIEDGETREFVSRQLGETEVHRRERTKSKGRGGGDTWSQGNSTGTAEGFDPAVEAAERALHSFVETGRSAGSSSGVGGSSSWNETENERTAILKNRLLNPDEVGREFAASKMRSIVFFDSLAFIVNRHNYDQTTIFDRLWTPINNHEKPMPWDAQKENELARTKSQNAELQTANDTLRKELESANAQVKRNQRKPTPKRRGNGFFQVYAGSEGWRTVRPWRLEFIGWLLDRPVMWPFALPFVYLFAVIGYVLLQSLVADPDDIAERLGGSPATLSGAFEIWWRHMEAVIAWLGGFFGFFTS